MSFSIPEPSKHVDKPFIDRWDLLPKQYQHPDIMFVIRRTMNENLCVYQLNRNANNELDEKQPILIYWIDLIDNMTWKKLPITMFEDKFGYGIDIIDFTSSTEIQFIIRAVKSHKITGKLKTTQPHRSIAFSFVNHEWSKIHSVDIYMDKVNTFTLLNPYNWSNIIKYIKINGYNQKGLLEQEIITK